MRKNKILRLLCITLMATFVLTMVGCSGCDGDSTEESKNPYISEVLKLPATGESMTITSSEENADYNKSITDDKDVKAVLEAIAVCKNADSLNMQCMESAGMLTVKVKSGETETELFLFRNMLQFKDGYVYLDTADIGAVYDIIKNLK